MLIRRLLLICLFAFTCALGVREVSLAIRVSRGISPAVVAYNASIPAVVRSLRPNYPYSVIAGGAYSAAELRYAVDKDSLVREHYGDFNLRDARLVTLTDERYQYVSYRLHNRVFWTRKRLRIPKGEVLLTDGTNFARTRCGNRLSNKAAPNTTAEEPMARMLSLPAFRPELLKTGEVTLAPAPPLGELAQNFPVLPFEMPTLAPYLPATGNNAGGPPAVWAPIGPFLPIVPITGGYVPPGQIPPTIPIAPLIEPPGSPPIVAEVPEPASLYLFGITLAVSLWLLTRMMRNRRPREDDVTEGEN